MPCPSIDFYNDAVDAVQAGQIPEALNAVENSLTEDPTDSQTWQLYIVILNALGRSEDADKATKKLKELGIDEADELLLMASKAAASNDLPAAIAHYQAATEVAPERAEIHAGLALALMENGQVEDALAAAKSGAAACPADPGANYALGRILRLSGKKESALAALTTAVAEDPGFMLALYEKGMCLADVGRLTESLAAFKKFLTNQPGDQSATEAVATITARINDSRTS